MKTMCPPATLLVPMNQRVLNKQSKERNISGHK